MFNNPYLIMRGFVCVLGGDLVMTRISCGFALVGACMSLSCLVCPIVLYNESGEGGLVRNTAVSCFVGEGLLPHGGGIVSLCVVSL